MAIHLISMWRQNNFSSVASNLWGWTALSRAMGKHDIFSYGYVDRSAHGMQTRRFLNYSIKEHTLLTADKMFKPESADSISTLVAATAAKKYPEGTLFSDAKFPLTNFKITEQEIVFIYQPYDVGPYAAGIIEIPISQHTLQPYMTPTAISTLGLESR